MGIRGYQKHIPIITTESQYSWGGTDYTQLALKSDTTIPAGLNSADYAEMQRENQPDITDATFVESFIIPTVFDVLTIVDGTIEGTIKLQAMIIGTYSVTSYISITKAELTIRAIDSAGSARTIAAKQTIWSGEIKAEDGATTTAEQLMYWIDVEDMSVSANERIVLDYTITYSTDDIFAQDDFRARLYCTPDTDETTITLPFVM